MQKVTHASHKCLLAKSVVLTHASMGCPLGHIAIHSQIVPAMPLSTLHPFGDLEVTRSKKVNIYILSLGVGMHVSGQNCIKKAKNSTKILF